MDGILLTKIAALLLILIFLFLFIIIRDPNTKAKSLLILGLILAFILYCFELFKDLGLFEFAVILDLFHIPIFFSVYPLAYIYLKFIIWRDFKPSKLSIIKYFSFVALATIIFWTYYLPLSYESKITFLSYYSKELPKTAEDVTVITILFIIYYFQVFTYLFAFSKIAIRINRASSKNIVIEEEYIPKWVWIFIFGVFTYEILMSFLYVFFDLHSEFAEISQNIFTFIFLAFIGFFELKQYDLLTQAKLKKLAVHFATENGAKKTSNTLTQSQKRIIIDTIESYISEKKIYLDPNLKIDQLAKKIHVPSQNLSLVINELLKKNFTAFLNEYRIKEAKKFIALNRNIASIEEIYSNFGFNSRSTFNRVFKSHTGLTPSEFKDSSFSN